MTRPSRWFPTCQDMSRLLSDAMDERLPWHLRARMYLHLRMCTLCECYRKHLALLRSVLRSEQASQQEGESPEGSPRPGLSPEAKQRIRQAMDATRP